MAVPNATRIAVFFFLLSTSGWLQAQSYLIPHCQDWPGTPNLSEDISFADMDGNGYPDMVGFDRDRLLVFFNHQGAVDTFPAVYAGFAPKSILDMALLDWNLDGKEDVVCLTENSQGLLLYINLGNAAFAAPVLLSASNDYDKILVKDFDSNGYPDLAKISYLNAITYLLNQGGNTNPTVVSRQIDQDLFYLDFADFNSDGYLDMVASNGDIPWPVTIRLFSNDGNFNFSPAGTLNFSPSNTNILQPINRLMCADLDNQNGPEILVKHSNVLYAYKNMGGFNFGSKLLVGDFSFSTTGYYGNTAFLDVLPDMDGNGFPDIAVGNSLFFNNNLSFSEKAITASPDFMGVQFVPVDTDLDGLQELWWVQSSDPLFHASCGVYRVRYLGGQALAPREKLREMYPQDADLPLFWVDIDKDGDLDAVYYSFRKIVASLNNGGVFAEKTLMPASWNGNYTLFDVDNDGLPDVITWTALYNYLTWWRNPGSGGSFIPKGFLYNAGGASDFQVIGSGDFNQDGTPELLVADEVNQLSVALRNLQFDGTQLQVVSSAHISTAGSFGSAVVSIADLNSDQFPDVVLFMNNGDGIGTDVLMVFHNNQGTGFTQVQQTALSSESGWIGLTDISLDGLPDAILSRNGQLYFAVGLSNGKFGTLQPGGQSVGAAFLADINSDGLKDLINRAHLRIGLNNGVGFSPLAYQGPLNEYYAPVDYDQDGDLDLLGIEGGQQCNWENNLIGPAQIVGKVFFDLNGDGVQGAGEPPLKQYKVQAKPLDVYAFTDTSGMFSIPMGANYGQFDVSLLSPYNNFFQFSSNPYPAAAQISTAVPSDTVSIGVQLAGGNTALLDQTLSGHRCSEVARLWIDVETIAPFDAPGRLLLRLPAGVEYLPDYATVPASFFDADQVLWQFDTLRAFYPRQLISGLKMPDFSHAGDTIIIVSTFQYWIGGDTTTVRDTLYSILTCAYDPNDKTVANIDDFYVGKDTYFTKTRPDQVEYLIRFQNTGTDTAAQVIILDNLPPEMDASSLQILSASHPFRAVLEQGSLLRVTFPAIQLPDSNANFLGSMGFVKFSLGFKPNPPRSKFIPNAARIIFDQNPPVHTNIARIMIVDCPFFGQASLEYPRCIGDTVLAILPNYGLQTSIQWTIDGLAAGQSDSQLIPVHDGLNLLRLRLDNGICQVDTSFSFTPNGSIPDLQLSLPGDTMICAGTSLPITSNIGAQWYRNDTLALGSGTMYSAAGTQTLKVVASNANGLCKAERTLHITAVPIPQTAIVELNPAYTQPLCPEDTLRLSTLLASASTWSVYTFQNSDPLFYSGPSISLAADIDPFLVVLKIDTLNCSILDERYVQFLQSGNFLLLGDSVVCDANHGAYFYVTDEEQFPIPYDSFLLYQMDSLVFSEYHNSGGTSYLFPVYEGDYVAVISSACFRDTIVKHFYTFESVAPHIEIHQDTLFSSNSSTVLWFYSPDLPGNFSQLFAFDNYLAQPATGYYYLYVIAGNCYGNSDTIFYQALAVDGPADWPGLGCYFNSVGNSLQVLGDIPPGTTYRLMDMGGKLVAQGALQAEQAVGVLPSGLYICTIQTGNAILSKKLSVFR